MYAQIAAGSAAQEEVSEFYRRDPPAQRGRTMTVGVQIASVYPTSSRTYEIEWQANSVRFVVDGASTLITDRAPPGPLGFVLWVDNQWLVFTPDGALGAGVAELGNAQWLDIAELKLTPTQV